MIHKDVKGRIRGLARAVIFISNVELSPWLTGDERDIPELNEIYYGDIPEGFHEELLQLCP